MRFSSAHILRARGKTYAILVWRTAKPALPQRLPRLHAFAFSACLLRRAWWLRAYALSLIRGLPLTGVRRGAGRRAGSSPQAGSGLRRDGAPHALTRHTTCLRPTRALECVLRAPAARLSADLSSAVFFHLHAWHYFLLPRGGAGDASADARWRGMRRSLGRGWRRRRTDERCSAL